jgi:hypothetical protein
MSTNEMEDMDVAELKSKGNSAFNSGVGSFPFPIICESHFIGMPFHTEDAGKLLLTRE